MADHDAFIRIKMSDIKNNYEGRNANYLNSINNI
jgi:hypothetical protein